MCQDGLGCSGQPGAVVASGRKWNLGGVSGSGWRKEGLSGCELREGQEKPVFTARTKNGLGEPRSWSGRWVRSSPQIQPRFPTSSPRRPGLTRDASLQETAAVGGGRASHSSGHVGEGDGALPLFSCPWLSERRAASPALQGPRSQVLGTGFPAPGPCLKVGPACVLLEGKAEGPMGG